MPAPSSMTATQILLAIVRRRYPDNAALKALTIAPTVREAWEQMSAAAGIDQWTLSGVIAKELGLDVADSTAAPDPFAVQLVPERLAREQLILPLRAAVNTLVVACAAPIQGGGIERVQFVSNRKLTLLVAPPEYLANTIDSAYSREAERESLVSERTESEVGTLHLTSEGEAVDVTGASEHAIVRLSRSLLLEAIEARASDVHMQPFAGGGIVRIRVDGVLRRLTFIRAIVMEQVIRYFKAQGGMDSTNNLAPQDGRMSLIIGSHDYDLRLSVLPASRGERLVIRFLDQSRIYRLGGSGLSTAAIQAIRRLGRNSSGVVLVTGPTGSGKTSTLYSLLSEINRMGVCIITVENPVEYRLVGISQVEISPKAGVTFASALRSILRQDPDVVLIGEIRDRETAEIAMEAALTGHLVLSTLHTNDALGAIPRLLDLGIQPSIMADALSGVVAQRLLRRLCEACRTAVVEPLKQDEMLFHQATGERPAYRAVGCTACKGSGYFGRQPVAEIVELTPAARRHLAGGESDLGKLRELTKGPLSSLAYAAALRVVSGDTSAGEAYRVIGQRFWNDVAAIHGRTMPSGANTMLSDDESATARLNILLYETRQDAKNTIANMLDPALVKIFAASEPQVAREILLKEEDVALLVVDVDAGPGGDNIELLKRLRVAMAWTRLPLVVIIPGNDKKLAKILEEHGVADYLIKPFAPEALMERITSVLRR